MDSLDPLQIHARYNRWMNEHLFNLCDGIPDHDRRQDRGAFFRSIHGTLNHILLADRLWLGRFLDRPFPVRALDDELYRDYETLKAERRATDAEIEAYVGGLSEAVLMAPITFTSVVDAQRRTFRLHDCLLHFFLHQVHHRGQITTLISQLGVDIGVTDLIGMPGIQHAAGEARDTPAGF